MRILQAHKYYWYRDGASNYALYLSELLTAAGHAVIPFAMRHERNLPSAYAPYFVTNMDLADPSAAGVWRKLHYAGRMVYSFEAKRHLRRLLQTTPVDIAHIHNIYHHISPSILPVLKKSGAKIVMTLHDYKLLCPNYTMFHHGQIHEEDARGWYGRCVKNKCMKDSRAQSLVVTAEMIWQHKIMRYFERYVDRFIAPSRFMRDLCVKYGWPAERFVVLPHPIDTNRFTLSPDDDGSVVYAGRLSEEKGLFTLIAAAEQTPQIRYVLIGTGPLETKLKAQVRSRGINNVSFTGFRSGAALTRLLSQARIIVLPSLWYENYPLSVLEAKAMGKIVVASRIGGLPEMLPADMLVPPGDADFLARSLQSWYATEPSVRRARGAQLRSEVERVNDPERHMEAIVSLYSSVISKQ